MSMSSICFLSNPSTSRPVEFITTHRAKITMTNDESYQFSFTWFRSGRHRQRLLPLGTLVKEGSKWVLSTEAPFMTILDVGFRVVLGGECVASTEGPFMTILGSVGLGVVLGEDEFEPVLGGDEAGVLRGEDVGLGDKMKGFGVKVLFLVMPSSFFVRPLTDSTPCLIPPAGEPFLDSGRAFRLFVSKRPEENLVISIIYVFTSNILS